MDIKKFRLIKENIERFLKVKKIENYKPSRHFDQKFGTSISGYYKFPFGLDEDVVWSVILPYHLKRENEELTKDILNEFTSVHFPYVNIEKLDEETKLQILMGMCSGFNKDDIIWWSIYNNRGLHHEENKKIMSLFSLKFGPSFYMSHVNWLPSRKTFNKIDKEMNDIYF